MKRIIIIGGGIAGLSAGIFAQMNGFDSVILEKHHTPGGQCTGWDRQNHHIDGCIHWLVGTKEGTPLHTLWRQVGALDGVSIHHPDTFMTMEHPEGTVHFHRDLQLLQSSWLALSPEDRKPIQAFCDALKALHRFEIPTGKPLDLMRFSEKLRHFLSIREAALIMHRYGKTSIRGFAEKFQHPALRDALRSLLPDHYSASSILFGLGAFTKGQSSIPMGGSRALSLRMAERYRALGGTLHTGKTVERLNIQGNRVVSAQCAQGERFSGDSFVAACDAHFLFKTLLAGSYDDPAFESRFSNPDAYPLASNIYVALGYGGSVGDQPRTLSFPIRPFPIHGRPIERLQLTHYSYEPDFAPPGHTVLTCAINQFQEDLDAWMALDKDSERYKEEKRWIADAVRAAVETRFPEMRGKLKVLDVATPNTYRRYCNAYRGAFMAFLPTTAGKELLHNGRISGLENLHLSGQWLQPPGGLPVALLTGKDTIQRLCREEGRPFVQEG